VNFFPKLCERFFVRELFEDVFESAGVVFPAIVVPLLVSMNRSSSFPSMVGMGGGSKTNMMEYSKAVESHKGNSQTAASFGDAVTLLKESELIQDFSLSLSGHMIVCTSRGTAEMTLDTLFSGAAVATSRVHELPPDAFMRAKEISSCVVCHPKLPFFLNANVDGSIALFQYGFPDALTCYRAGPAPRVLSLKYSCMGNRFGSIDDSGSVSLWQFDSSLESHTPFCVIQAHTQKGNDLCFLETGNVVASAGLSHGGKSSGGANLCLWDTLITPSKRCVGMFKCHSLGASTLCYAESSRLLVSGGKEGDICLWDIRQRKLLTTIQAHEKNVKSMDFDSSTSTLVSGSTDGSVKLWTFPDMQCKQVFADAHKTHSVAKGMNKFLTSAVSTFGVLNVQFHKGMLYSCGVDGRLNVRSCSFNK
jgi:WD40 repeat protein